MSHSVRSSLDAQLVTYLAHPLLGIEPRRTAVALSYLLIGSFAIQVSGARAVLFAYTGPHLPGVVDQLSGGTILLTMAATFLFAIAYPLWNGGPLLAIAIPLMAPLSGAVSAGTIALDVDMTLALATGALGAAIATLREVHRGAPHRTAITLLDATILTSVAVMIAGVAVIRIADVVGSHATQGVWIAGIATLAAGVSVCYVWNRLIPRSATSPSTRVEQ